MTKLRLGPIIEDKPVKLTVELNGRLFILLCDYSKAHAKETGLAEPLPPERLIGPMIERFIAADRVFSRSRGQK